MDINDREFFDRVFADMDDSVAKLAIQQLSKYLYQYYGKKLIVLLDEYDTPMQKAYLNDYWDEMGLQDKKEEVKRWYDGFNFGLKFEGNECLYEPGGTKHIQLF